MRSIKEILKEQAPSMTLLEEGLCDGCGFPIKVFETEIIGGPNKGQKTKIVYGCKCEDMKLAKEAMENKEKYENRKVREHFNYYSLISRRLKEASLKNYIPQNRSQAVAKREVQQYINEFDIHQPVNLLFTGSYGIGKSHLAKSITDGVMQRENPETGRKYTAIFISVPKLLRKIRGTYNRNSDISEEEIFEALESVDLLVLDDLGAEKKTDWSDERLFDIIDSRQGMNTIYTTNLDEEQLFETFGERNFSRIVNEDTQILAIEGKNHRLRDLNIG